MTVQEEAPVLIAGGGLVGLSTAMFLARQGIASIAVERLKTPSTLPRAAFFHMRTFELFRQAGLEGTVRSQSQKEFVPDGAIVGLESLAGRQIAAFIPTLNEGVEQLSPCRRWFVSQPGLEPILRRRAKEVGASVVNGLEVVGADQDAGGVTVTVKDVETGQTREMRSQYLIACEGAHSRIRDLIGAKLEGRGVFSNSVTIYLRANLAPLIGDRNLSIIYVNNPVLSGFFRLEKGSQRGFLVVSTIGDPLTDPVGAANAAADISEARLIELVRAAAGDPDLEVEIEGVARWRCTSDVADRYRDGRIFLAGDTAHLMPPNGGFGGNTGIHDAHNLAWKLAMVMKGQAGPGLLDSYEAERRPVGRFTVDQAYTRYVTRSAAYLGAKDPPPYADDFEIELGYLYRSNAVVAEGGAPEGHENPRVSFGRPGSRAPHVWLERDGKRISSLDLFGDGFVLLVGPDGEAWRGTDVAVAGRFEQTPFEIIRIGDEVTDPEGRFAEAYGLSPSGATLVRPDGFVAWRCRTLPADPSAALLEALEGVLAWE
jgi:2-polyprenyl-6-methoxyphenol hydroxylase-like FAD-dependent oxidoreductase